MKVIDLDSTLTVSGWAGGIVAALLLDGAHHSALAAAVVSATQPYGQTDPVAEVCVDANALDRVASDDGLPAEARLRASLAMDLLTEGSSPSSFLDFVGGCWDHANVKRVLTILWAHHVGDTLEAPPHWPTS